MHVHVVAIPIPAPRILSAASIETPHIHILPPNNRYPSPPYPANLHLSAPDQFSGKSFLISLPGPKSTLNRWPESGYLSCWSPSTLSFECADAIYMTSRFLPDIMSVLLTHHHRPFWRFLPIRCPMPRLTAKARDSGTLAPLYANVCKHLAIPSVPHNPLIRPTRDPYIVQTVHAETIEYAFTLGRGGHGLGSGRYHPRVGR